MTTSYVRRIFLPSLWRRTHCLFGIVARSLFTDSDTKIENYLRQRIFRIDQLGCTGKAVLLQKIREVKIPMDAKLAAFSIAELIHTAESETELCELERVFKLISHHKTAELVSFHFGASLIRLYHHLGLPERAFSVYKDPVCRNLLRDNTCHKVLMNLLYNHGHYEWVLDVYTSMEKFNIDCVTMALAAHYHINTEKSFKASQALLKDLLRTNTLSRRALLYAAMLAYNQKSPQAAMDILQICKEDNVAFNIKLMCQSRLGQLDHVLKNIQFVVDKADDITKPLSVRIYRDTVDEIKSAVAANGSSIQSQTFAQLERDLAFRGALSTQVVPVLIDRMIIGESGYRKEKGKHKVKQVV